jgi:hypothetical protein
MESSKRIYRTRAKRGVNEKDLDYQRIVKARLTELELTDDALSNRFRAAFVQVKGYNPSSADRDEFLDKMLNHVPNSEGLLIMELVLGVKINFNIKEDGQQPA